MDNRTAEQQRDKDAIIVGAGIGGLAMACFLSDQGYRVKVFEKNGDPEAGYSDGRSINFTLSRRGLHALERLGVAEEALAGSVKLEGRVVHVKGRPDAGQPYGVRPGQAIYSIQRRRLIDILLKSARARAGVEMFFGRRLESLDKDAARCVFVNTADGVRETHAARFVVGADGAFSQTRQAIMRGQIVNFEQTFFDWIYKETLLSSADARSLGLKGDALHVWPNHPSLLVGIPNPDGSVSCLYATPLPAGRQISDPALNRLVSDRFRREYGETCARAPSLHRGMDSAGVGTLVSVKVSRWHHNDKVVLLGDACHAIFPFYGQGMNAALEDCLTLSKTLVSTGSPGEAFAAFEAARKENTDALHEISQKNFLVMRDRADSPFYSAKVRVDAFLARSFPSAWMHEYEEIAHKLTPMKTVRRVLARQAVLRYVLGICIADWALGTAMLAQRLAVQAAWAVRAEARAFLEGVFLRPLPIRYGSVR